MDDEEQRIDEWDLLARNLVGNLSTLEQIKRYERARVIFRKQIQRKRTIHACVVFVGLLGVYIVLV